jgi:sodium/pantothenate symporter
MSTVDSQLILASATLVKDLFVRYGRPGEPLPATAARTLRRAGFATTALLGLIVFAASLKPPSLIVWINLFAFGGLQAAFLWPLVLGLYWRRANGPGALASMVTGLGSFFFLSVYVKRFLGMHVIVPTLIAALVVFVAVSLATRAPDEATLAPFWVD